MNNLKTAMTMRGMRAADLARAIGMRPDQLNKHLNDGRPIGPKLVKDFAQALCVSEAYLRGTPQRLAVRDLETGDTLACEIMEEVVIGGYGIFYVVAAPNIGPVSVILTDGIQLTTRDWRGPQPLSAADIGQYRWVNALGREAAMVDGLPRALEAK